MAATIAITLYWQIPRVAFQSQRQKEQLLIERGEQYRRAIQLFVRANNRYPSKLEDLENLNNRRFLRRKFKDPMTGKDEWRLIHVNAAGVITDSIINEKKAQPDTQASQNTFVGTEAYLAPDPSQQAQQGPTAITRRRQSEGAAPVDANGQPLFPSPNPQAQNFQQGAAPPPFPQPGGQLGILGQSTPTGQQIGAGIAGVASTFEAHAIMVYNEHTNYNEWEFIFVANIPAAAIGTVPGGAPGIPVIATGQPGGTNQTASLFFTSDGTPGQQTTPGGAPVQQQSPIPSWFRFGEP
jgi:type II secretory pathway pseudopilin PulG